MFEIRRIFHYVKPYSKNIYKALICNIFYAFFSLFTLTMIVPFISVMFGLITPIYTQPEITFSTQSIIDLLSYFITKIQSQYGLVASMIFIASIFIFCSFLSNLFRYLYWYFIAPINSNTVRDLRNELYHKVLILPLSFYTKHQSGDILTRLNADMQEIDTLIRRTIELVLQQPFVILVFFITLLIINPWLTLLSIIILPTVGFVAGKISKKIRQKAKKGQQEMSTLASHYEESISGIRVIKSFHAEKYFNEKFANANNNYTTTTNKIIRYSELSAPLSEILTVTAMLFVIFIGSIFVLNNTHFSSESLILFVIVFARLIPPIQSSIRAYSYIQKGIISAKRIFEIMDSDEKIIEKNNALPIKKFKDSIVFKDVNFSYEHQLVLKNINLCLRKGETIALVGHSGSGKSSIINLLLRLYDINSGLLTIDNLPIKDYVISDVRALFGLVTQEVILFNDTIEHNISFGNPNISQEKIIAAAKKANAHDFIMETPQGYQTIIGDRGMNLSGGQRQRLSIARAILHQPEILLLDEATSALDSQSEQIVQAAIDEIVKETTTIIIAHRLSTVQNANRIIVLNEGKIVEEGNHQQLMNLQGIYHSMIVAQELK